MGKINPPLTVHIADVTHYLISGHAMDDDARRRCTSVYLPTGVLPMLPPELSENLCSLRGGVPRLAFSTKMTFDAKTAELLDWEHMRSVIKVRENLSYDHVNEMIEKGQDSIFAAMWDFARKLEERGERLEIVTQERRIRFPETGEGLGIQLKSPSPATQMIEQFMVVTNEAVARTIHEAGIPSVYRIHPLPDRTNIERWNGMCDALGHEEARLEIDFDSLNRSVNEGKKERVSGKSMRSDDVLSMLQAGGTLSLGGFGGPVGITMKDEEKDGNEKRNEGDANGVNSVGGGQGKGRGGEEGEGRGRDEREGKGRGADSKGETHRTGSFESLAPMDPEDLAIVGAGYRAALKAVSEMDGETGNLLYQRILSTMPRAVYSVNNHGHFGLNSLCYTHFTSPIRRYPDVLVHRILADIISERPFTDEEKSILLGDLEVMVDICNDQTRAAEDLERGMIDIALATRASQDQEYRSAKHPGVVTGLTPTSCFISLDGVTEGRIALSRLAPVRLSLDESESRILIGEAGNDPAAIKRGIRELQKVGFLRQHDDPGEAGASSDTSSDASSELSSDFDSEIELIRLGQRVKCKVRSVDISEGKVDLSLSP